MMRNQVAENLRRILEKLNYNEDHFIQISDLIQEEVDWRTNLEWQHIIGRDQKILQELLFKRHTHAEIVYLNDSPDTIVYKESSVIEIAGKYAKRWMLRSFVQGITSGFFLSVLLYVIFIWKP